MTTKTNENGLVCPECDSIERFEINMACCADYQFDEDGKFLEQDLEPLGYEDDARCVCHDCGHAATIRDFTPGAEPKPKPRYYVTMTWDDWPEGGSYGAIVEAETHEEAEAQVRQSMAECRAEDCEEGEEEADPAHWLEAYADQWHVVDCQDFDEFVANNPRK